MATGKQEPSREQHDFDDKVVSALGEAFNNVAIHAYRGMAPGLVDLEIEASAEGITLHMSDAGHAFEPRDEGNWTPAVEALPESHMGLYIMRSCMDRVTYLPGGRDGAHNRLTLTKRFVP
jgi:serine/threonine-protein kinase RsbW